MPDGDHDLPAPAATPLWVAAWAAVVSSLMLWAPWVRSGTRWRNAYEAIDLADRLGALESGGLKTLAVVTVAVPLLSGAGMVLLARHRPWAALLSLGAAGGGAMVARATAGATDLTIGVGAHVTGLAGVTALVATAAAIWPTRART